MFPAIFQCMVLGTKPESFAKVTSAINYEQSLQPSPTSCVRVFGGWGLISKTVFLCVALIALQLTL